MYGHMGGMGFGLGFLNFLGTILFFVAVFWALRFFFRGGMHKYRHGGYGKGGKWRDLRGRYSGPRPWESRSDGAEQTLRDRLARGEIKEDEYNRLKTQLGGNGSDGKGGPNGGPRPDGGPLGWLRGDDALEVARLRLAKGEISADEFETLRRVLTS